MVFQKNYEAPRDIKLVVNCMTPLARAANSKRSKYNSQPYNKREQCIPSV